MYHLRRQFSHVGRLLQQSKLTATSEIEMSHFNQLASTWWDVNGPQRILHKMNLLRMDFINDTIKSHLKLNKGVTDPEEQIYIPPFNVDNVLPKEIADRINGEQEIRRQQLWQQLKLDALDIGCGGGILSESLARLPVVNRVKGIDLSTEVLEVARQHKKLDPMVREKLTYELKAVEDLDPDTEQYDVVTMFEMLEHVNYPAEVLKAALRHVKPGGWIFISTINRDLISWFTTIFMGEHILKIVPLGTHTYDKYINEKELEKWVEDRHENSDLGDLRKQFEVAGSKGCVYLPCYGWKFTDNVEVGNYFMALKRRD
ncbi:hypothetical protein LJB42_004849 [Komagataella kurtzmanii]|nr:hypothetical protein LJB42_004849 [Komagataella kurtzmanii]